MNIRDIQSLLDSWQLHLSAERKSPQTMKTYSDGVKAFIRWAEQEGCEPSLDRPPVNKFVAHLLDSGASAATARSRQLAVRRFSAWLADEGEIEVDALATLKPPKLDRKVIPELDEDELNRLAKVCGNDFRGLRDEAIIRLMAETGMRAGEVVAMTTEDINLRAGEAVVRRGKGGKGRTVSFGPKTGLSIDRYVRRGRSTHRMAHLPELWLGDRQRGSPTRPCTAPSSFEPRPPASNSSPHTCCDTRRPAGGWTPEVPSLG
nr:tyrosine-type recombinase/integrase [Streptomyces composti]